MSDRLKLNEEKRELIKKLIVLRSKAITKAEILTKIIDEEERRLKNNE